MNNYLIPANTKKSMLIFGLFNAFDLILFASGVAVSLILLLILPVDKILFAVIALLPGVVTGFLVLPVPNYHNILTVIKSAFAYFTERRKFVWKGWCFTSDKEQEK